MQPTTRIAGAIALAACAHANTHAAPFQLTQMAVFSEAGGASITPSSGAFVTQNAAPDEENLYLVGSDSASGKLLVDNGAGTWKNNLDALMASTWLSVDRFGPNGQDGAAAYGTGWYGTAPTLPPGSPLVHVPGGERSIGGPGLVANGLNGDPVNGDGRSPGFFADASGFAWWNDHGTATESAGSFINAQRFSSIFIGHFVLTDPNATLLGEDLLAFFWPHTPQPDAGEVYNIPLDGSLGSTLDGSATVPYWLEYERTTFTNSLGTFTALDMYLVPAPAAVLPLLALAPLARRRRDVRQITP